MKAKKTLRSLAILILTLLILFTSACTLKEKEASLPKQNESTKIISEGKGQEEANIPQDNQNQVKEEKPEEKPSEQPVQKPETKPVPKTKPAETPAAPAAKTGRAEVPTKYDFTYLKSVEDEIVKLCNAEREKEGLKHLVMNETLRLSARYKSNEMLQYEYFEHNSPITGYKPWDLAKTFGYSYTAFGENIWYSKGYSQAQIEAKLIVDGWMNSEGHRKNIMNGKFGRIGVGVIYSSANKTAEATQQFSN